MWVESFPGVARRRAGAVFAALTVCQLHSNNCRSVNWANAPRLVELEGWASLEDLGGAQL